MLTHRQASQAAQVPWWARSLLRVLQPVISAVPPLGRALGKTLPNRVGQVDRLRADGKRREAFELAIRGASEASERKGFLPEMNGFYFWFFISSAADVAGSSEEQQQVLDSIGRAPEPGGLYEARTLGQISRWRWSAGDAAGVLETARKAVAADPTSPGEQELLAFYLEQSGR